jgi:hypothetical protein
MQYPIKLAEVMDGFLLYVPVPELVRPTYEDLRTGDKTVTFPFWAKFWASSRALVSLLYSIVPSLSLSYHCQAKIWEDPEYS